MWIEIIERTSTKHKIESLSARRVWIEIRTAQRRLRLSSESLSARRVWIEICWRFLSAHPLYESLSARRVWIEIGRPYPLHRAAG